MDRSLPGPPVHGVLQGRTLETAAMPPPGDLHNGGMEVASLMSPALAGSLHEGHLEALSLTQVRQVKHSFLKAVFSTIHLDFFQVSLKALITI